MTTDTGLEAAMHFVGPAVTIFALPLLLWLVKGAIGASRSTLKEISDTGKQTRDGVLILGTQFAEHVKSDDRQFAEVGDRFDRLEDSIQDDRRGAPRGRK